MENNNVVLVSTKIKIMIRRMIRQGRQLNGDTWTKQWLIRGPNKKRHVNQ